MFKSSFSTLLVLALGLSSSNVLGQDLSGLPTCGQNCLVSAFTSSAGGCSQTDFACLCKSKTFINSTTTCYASSCSASDATAATSWGTKTCATVGVNVAANITNTTSTNESTGKTTSNSTATATINGTSASTSAKSAGNVVSVSFRSAGVLVGSGMAALAIASL